MGLNSLRRFDCSCDSKIKQFVFVIVCASNSKCRPIWRRLPFGQNHSRMRDRDRHKNFDNLFLKQQWGDIDMIRSTLFPAENESKSKHFFSIFVTLSTSSNSTFMSGNSNSLCFVNFLVLYFPIVESIGIIMMTLKKTGMKSIYRIVPFWLMWFLHLSLSLCVFAYYRFVDSNKSEIIADNSVFYIFYNISRFTWYITFNFSFIAC